MPRQSAFHGVTPVTVAEPPMNRRLADKISDAIAHALSQGHDELVSRLGLIYDSMVETEAARGYANRSDDELRTWLDHRFK